MTEELNIESNLIFTPKYTISNSERKLSLLENRLMGPNKEGKKPIKNNSNKNELENIKKQIFKNEQSTSIKSISRSTNFSLLSNFQLSQQHSSIMKDCDLYEFLKNKRKTNNDNIIQSIPPLNNIKFLNSNLKKKQKKKKIQMRNKKIKEFLKSPSSNSKNLNINLKNSSFSNSYKSNNEIIEKFKNDINKKNEEISNLKQIMNELMEKINNLEEGKEKTQNKIKSYEKEIAKFVIENAELKRNILKKEISDKKYSIGKLNIKKTENGIGEYFSEGNEFKRIAGLINNINEKRTELNLLSLTKNTDLLNYKINEYNKKEIEIREYQEQLYLEKINQINNILTLREEEKCKYNKNWVLIGEKYQLVSLIGKGGYSEIYKAYDIKNQKYVACKIHQLNVNWSNQMKDSYINHTVRENEILKLINHKNIVKHLDTIMIDNNSFCTVIELCNGKDLSSIIHERKKLSENEVKVITKQIVNALIYLSSLNKKIIHYDLKPQNILFNNYEVKITDFGLAKLIENGNSIELTSQGTGTYFYLPPECFNINNNVIINQKVDIWSLGIIVYEMLFGNKPFGNNITQIQYIRDKIYNNLKYINFNNKSDDIKISEDCKNFIKGCLEFDINKRFSAEDANKSAFLKNITV